MSREFEHIIKAKLANHEVSPPSHLHGKIKSQYPKSSVKDYIIRFRLPAAIISSITIIAIIGSLYVNNNQTKNSEYKPTISEINNSAPIEEKSNIQYLDENINAEKTTNNNIVLNQTITKANNIRIDANIFMSIDTTVCGNTFVLDSDIKIEELSTDQDFAITRTQNNNIIVCCTESGTGSYYLYYTKRNGNSIIGDTLLIHFQNTKHVNINIVESINCVGDPLLVNIENTQNSILTWDIPNGEINQINETDFIITWQNYKEPTDIITLTIENNGCVSTTEKTIQLPKLPNVSIKTETDFCNTKSGSIQLTSNDNRIFTFALESFEQNNTGVFKNLNANTYQVIIGYNNTCKHIIPVEVPSSGNIKSDFIIEHDLINHKQIRLINNTTLDGKHYSEFNELMFEWEINDEIFTSDNPVYEYAQGGEHNIILKAHIGKNCKDEIIKTVSFNEDLIQAPNIFSPNGDGISDIFKVKTGEISDFEGIITNPQGEIIYRWNNPQGGWDGKINSQNLASEGVYYYIIKVLNPNGKPIEKKGVFQLVRN